MCEHVVARHFLDLARLDLHRLDLELFRYCQLLRLLPRELVMPEVPVLRRRLVDGPLQVEVPDRDASD